MISKTKNMINKYGIMQNKVICYVYYISNIAYEKKLNFSA